MSKQPADSREEGTEEACAKRRYTITLEDLPLSCPGKYMKVWNAHPRVYFPIQETGEYRCPYCSAEYVLEI